MTLLFLISGNDDYHLSDEHYCSQIIKLIEKTKELNNKEYMKYAYIIKNCSFKLQKMASYGIQCWGTSKTQILKYFSTIFPVNNPQEVRTITNALVYVSNTKLSNTLNQPNDAPENHLNSTKSFIDNYNIIVKLFKSSRIKFNLSVT